MHCFRSRPVKKVPTCWDSNGASVITIFLAALCLCVPAFCLAAERIWSQQQKIAFLRALSERDSSYDPVEKMIRRPFSSPGYHTTLKGGSIHPTRDSLQYAVALLDSGDPNRAAQAQDILRKVISLQDQNPSSRTYGIWPWFLEEPLEKMSPPDWNWADFCGAQLLQVAIDHLHRLPEDIKQKVKDSILHAAHSIKRRNVGPGYTNIAVMGTYVTLVAGELFNVSELADYGKARLRRFYDYTVEHGSFTEYNSPTYTVVTIKEISRMLRHVKDSDSQKLLRELNHLAWQHLARRFHPPTRQWSGPHSRCYSTLLSNDTLVFIQRATNHKVRFMPETATFESLDAHRLNAECPPDLFGYFTDLPAPRLEIESFVKNSFSEYDTIGTTYLHLDFTLGSVNIGDLWNQRRPLLAYWKTDSGVVAMRIRCLHDNYDYASASIFTVQDKSDILGAIIFATDRGDTHISLDRIENATIKATDLRIRIQFEGAVADLKLPPKVEIGRPIHISSGPVDVDFQIAYAAFDNYPVTTEVGRAWLDIVFYSGPQKTIDFRQINDAAFIFALSVNPYAEDQDHLSTISNLKFEISNSGKDNLFTANWNRPPNPQMSLTIPAKPDSSSKQKANSSAKLGQQNLWKTKPPR